MVKNHKYNKRYKEDKFLPSTPYEYYKNSWISWYDFLDITKPKNEFYKKIEDAKKAVNNLGIKNSEEYRIRYKEDSKLHSDPYEYYKNNWVSWYDFLNKIK